MTVSTFFSIFFISSLTAVVLILTGPSSSRPVGAPGSRPRAPVGRADSSLLDAQDFLDRFLNTLNLTEQRPDARTGSTPTGKETEEYMLDLYKRLAHDQASVANIVRSFKNEDSSSFDVSAPRVRIYPLSFNITMPRRELVTVAELRLLILVQRAQRWSAGLNCKVSVYQKHKGTEEVEEGVKRRDKAEEVGLRNSKILMTKHIHTTDNSWVSFDLTQEVTLWQESGAAEIPLEVHVTTQGSQEVVIDRDLEGRYNAEIIVFSDDEYEEQRLGQATGQGIREDVQQGRRDPQERAGHQGEQSFLHSNFIYDKSPRIRRHAKSEPCNRAPLFVDFKEIGWDNWVVQPLGYEAYRCKGVCSPPLTSEVSPTNHALVQTALSFKSPEKVSPACCVPTKLEPISLLYYDNGVVTYKHKYEGMVVAECGCR